MRSPRTGLALKLARWRLMTETLRPRLDEFPWLREHHAALERLVADAEELLASIAGLKGEIAHRYARLDEVAATADEMQTRLRSGLHELHGRRDPKLIQYGVDPLRTRGKDKQKRKSPVAKRQR